jgi:hypothetical protein
MALSTLDEFVKDAFDRKEWAVLPLLLHTIPRLHQVPFNDFMKRFNPWLMPHHTKNFVLNYWILLS